VGVKKKIVIYSLLGLVVLLISALSWLEYTGRTNIIADYYAPQYVWDLTDGDALSAQDIQQFIKSHNPNVENSTGLKLSHYCRKFKVNPAFALAIAEADSSQGMAGAGRGNKNPGNTKISYQRLDQLGIEHAWFRASNNFAVFKTWGDGYAAIAITLANYSYYNLRGQIDPILRTYAGQPNPNYYVTVKGVMSNLLSRIDIKVKLKSIYSDRSVKGSTVILRRDGKKIKTIKADKDGLAVFSNLPRARYRVVVKSSSYRTKEVVINSPQKTTKLTVNLSPKDRNYFSGEVQKLIMDTPDNEGVIIKLSGQDGELIKKTRTAKDGFYYFGDLLPGRYVVSLEPRASLPTGFYFYQEVDLTKKPQSGINFIY
jgi:hypothetical protein